MPATPYNIISEINMRKFSRSSATEVTISRTCTLGPAVPAIILALMIAVSVTLTIPEYDAIVQAVWDTTDALSIISKCVCYVLAAGIETYAFISGVVKASVKSLGTDIKAIWLDGLTCKCQFGERRDSTLISHSYRLHILLYQVISLQPNDAKEAFNPTFGSASNHRSPKFVMCAYTIVTSFLVNAAIYNQLEISGFAAP
jgi:hypothetical protein